MHEVCAHDVCPYAFAIHGATAIEPGALCLGGLHPGAWRSAWSVVVRVHAHAAHRRAGTQQAICGAAFGPAHARATDAALWRERYEVPWATTGRARASARQQARGAASGFDADCAQDAGAADADAAGSASQSHAPPGDP